MNRLRTLASSRYLTALVLGALIANPNAEAKIVERVVAIVFDLPILESDLLKLAHHVKNDGLLDEALIATYDRKSLANDRAQMISYLIDERILDFEVKKKNLEVTFERVEQEIRNITQSKGISRAQLKSALSQKGVPFSEYQNFIKSSIQRQSLIEREVTSKIRISDEDVASFFLSQRGAGRAQVFEFDISHILFLPSNGGAQAAEERAQKALARLRESNLTFEKVAEQLSEDPNFSQGGFLGSFKSGEMLPEFNQALRDLKVGDHSEVIRTKMGFHILKVLKKVLISDPELDAKRDEIRSILFADTFRRQFRSWLDSKKNDAFIKQNL